MSSIRFGFRHALPGALAAAGILGLAAAPAFAQRPPLRHLADVKTLPGTLVAQAQLAQPETALGITGYRIEHVTLPEPASVRLRGRAQDVTEGWHVTVTFARPLTVRSQAFSLVFDGRWCGFLQEAPDLKSADAVCFEAELIRDGAALGVTYRGIQITSRDTEPEAASPLAPEAVLAQEGEDLHYVSGRLRLQEAR
jgi:hypothetical protein